MRRGGSRGIHPGFIWSLGRQRGPGGFPEYPVRYGFLMPTAPAASVAPFRTGWEKCLVDKRVYEVVGVRRNRGHDLGSRPAFRDRRLSGGDFPEPAANQVHPGRAVPGSGAVHRSDGRFAGAHRRLPCLASTAGRPSRGCPKYQHSPRSLPRSEPSVTFAGPSGPIRTAAIARPIAEAHLVRPGTPGRYGRPPDPTRTAGHCRPGRPYAHPPERPVMGSLSGGRPANARDRRGRSGRVRRTRR